MVGYKNPQYIHHMRLVASKVGWHVASNIKIAMITASMQMVSCLLYVERKDVSSTVNIIIETRVEREAVN